MRTTLGRLHAFMRDHERTALIALFVFSFLLRAAHVAYVYQHSGTAKWSDDWLYLAMGQQLAAGDWTPSIYGQPYMIVGPMIPALIALFIAIFGSPIVPFFLYNIAITSLVSVILYLLGKEIFSRPCGWFMAAWGVFNIEYFKYNPFLLKEATVFLFLPLTLLFLLKSIRTDSGLKNAFWAALAFAWLIHADERYVFYLPFFALFYLVAKPFQLKKAVRKAGIWVGLVFLLMLPWGIRNYLLFKQVVIISPRTTAFTAKFWGKDFANLTFTDKSGFARDIFFKKPSDYEKKHGLTPRKYGETEARVKAFKNFWQPAYFKPTYIQYGFRLQKWSLIHNISGIVFYGVFLPFYFLGIFMLIKKRHLSGIFIAFIPIMHSLVHAYMIWPLERYRSPINFIVVMIGIWAILSFFEKKRQTQLL